MTLPLKEKLHIHYPSSDGKPMADNTRQWNWIAFIKLNIEEITKGKEIFVASDLLWYPVEGNNKFRVAPDVMVAIGRPKGDRNSYLQWQEDNIAPQIVFEILSPSNTKKEMKKKLKLYESQKVEEYYVYDPDFNRLEIYQRKKDKLVQQDKKEWISPLLQFKLIWTKDTLKLFFPDGSIFKSFGEVVTESKAVRIEVEEAKAEAKEAKVEAKEAKVEAKEAKVEAEEAKVEAEEAKVEAKEAKNKLKILEAKLKELGIDPDSLG